MNGERLFIDPLDMAIADVNSEWLGIARKQLMENAGAQVASFVLDNLMSKHSTTTRTEFQVIVFSGTGGNGGDGFVAARRLANHPRIRKPLLAFLVGDEYRIRSRISRENWESLKKMLFTIKPQVLTSSLHVEQVHLDVPHETSMVVIIDALLGTGVRGKIREPVRSAIIKINDWKRQHPETVRVISVDVPSGMNPATGTIEDVAVDPDWIISLHAPKKGLQQVDPNKVIIKDIGIPMEAEHLCGPGYIQIVRSRNPWSHKGEHGRLWIVGGSKWYSGAPILSALAAQQMGIDLVTIFAPEVIASTLRSFSPNIIVHPHAGDVLTWDALQEVLPLENLDKKKPDAVLIGPGCGDAKATLDGIHELITVLLRKNVPMIIDADALKVINRFERLGPQVILTPHAGEFKFITGNTLPQGDDAIIERINRVQDAVEQYQSIFLVKGRWDVICGPSSNDEHETTWRLNVTGTPAMTVGGTGDVLAGAVAALTAITKRPFHSACLGAFLVGRSGELATNRQSIIKATDVIELLPEAIKESWQLVKNS